MGWGCGTNSWEWGVSNSGSQSRWMSTVWLWRPAVGEDCPASVATQEHLVGHRVLQDAGPDGPLLL